MYLHCENVESGQGNYRRRHNSLSSEAQCLYRRVRIIKGDSRSLNASVQHFILEDYSHHLSLVAIGSQGIR